MVKSKTIYVCQNCGAKETKWTGRCNVCGEWNSFVEEVEVTSKSRGNAVIGNPSSKALRLSEIKVNADVRMDTGDNELNRVLGGGMVPGSMILLGGEPGIGKSTLVLQFALHNRCGKVLYVSGEESISQIKMRAQRLGAENDECLFLSGNSLEMVLQHARAILPDLLIIDSIQTLATEAVDSIPGSLSQIRECTNTLLRFSKENTISTILIGHITKDGQLAGPKILEHMVDTVLQFEGDQQYMYRILRSMKNRFGSTSEIGIYEMLQSGLRQVTNPSELLLSNHDQELSGIAVSATVEGVRPILLEVQSLVSTAAYGVPQRSATGFDSRRLNMLLAVLEKRAGYFFSRSAISSRAVLGPVFTSSLMEGSVSDSVSKASTGIGFSVLKMRRIAPGLSMYSMSFAVFSVPSAAPRDSLTYFLAISTHCSGVRPMNFWPRMPRRGRSPSSAYPASMWLNLMFFSTKFSMSESVTLLLLMISKKSL